MKYAVVLASAPGGVEEAREWDADTVRPWPVLAVNRAGLCYQGEIAAWGSVHANELAEWVTLRRELEMNVNCPIFGESFLPGQDRACPTYYGPVKWRGSSALYVVQWALEQGYSRLVLAGVHLTGNTREHPGEVLASPGPYEQYREGWRDAFTEIRGRVYSLGGWTREFLGPPPGHWRQ